MIAPIIAASSYIKPKTPTMEQLYMATYPGEHFGAHQHIDPGNPLRSVHLLENPPVLMMCFVLSESFSTNDPASRSSSASHFRFSGLDRPVGDSTFKLTLPDAPCGVLFAISSVPYFLAPEE